MNNINAFYAIWSIQIFVNIHMLSSYGWTRSDPRNVQNFSIKLCGSLQGGTLGMMTKRVHENMWLEASTFLNGPK